MSIPIKKRWLKINKRTGSGANNGFPFISRSLYLFEREMLRFYRAEKIMDMILPSAIMVIDHYITNNRTYLYLACADGFIKILELQLEGKKKMNTGDFLRGYRFEK